MTCWACGAEIHRSTAKIVRATVRLTFNPWGIVREVRSEGVTVCGSCADHLETLEVSARVEE